MMARTRSAMPFVYQGRIKHICKSGGGGEGHRRVAKVQASGGGGGGPGGCSPGKYFKISVSENIISWVLKSHLKENRCPLQN